MNNAWFITNIMLFRLSHFMIQKSSSVLLPTPSFTGSQNQKVDNLYSFIRYLNNTDFKNELEKCISELDENIYIFTDDKLPILRRHILELVEMYFSRTDGEHLKYQKASIKINYTPRHYIASFFLQRNYQTARELKDIFAEKWEYIWDAQTDEFDEKLQLFKDILRLPSNERLGRNW